MPKKPQGMETAYWTRSSRKLGTRELLERKRKLLFINKTHYHSDPNYKKVRLPSLSKSINSSICFRAPTATKKHHPCPQKTGPEKK